VRKEIHITQLVAIRVYLSRHLIHHPSDVDLIPIPHTVNDLKLPLEKTPLRKPSSNILSIPLNPICLGTDIIQALRKTLIESLGTLILEELLNLTDCFLGSERVGNELDYGAEHGETGRKFLD
jgi:hypothetical protein